MRPRGAEGGNRMNQPLLPRPRFWALAISEKKSRRPILSDMLRFLVVFLIATVVQSMLLSVPITVWVLRNGAAIGLQAEVEISSIQQKIQELLSRMPAWLEISVLFAGLAYGAAAIFYCKRFEKRSLASMGIVKKGALAELGAGLLIGCLLIGGLTAIGVAAGGLEAEPFSVESSRIPLLLLALTASLVAGAGQELLLRGYFTPTVSGGVPAFFAVTVSTAVSMILTTSAKGIIAYANILLLNLLLCVCTIKRGNLWAAIGLHGGWLFAAHFLFGFDLPADNRLCMVRVNGVSISEAMTGGVNGPTGSICATIVLIAAVAAVFALRAKDPAPPAPKEDEPAAEA